MGGAASVAGQHARRRRALHCLGRGWGLVAQPEDAQGREVVVGRRRDPVQLLGRAVGQLLQVLVLQLRGLSRSQRLHQVARALLLRGEIAPQPLELRRGGHPQPAAPPSAAPFCLTSRLNIDEALALPASCPPTAP